MILIKAKLLISNDDCAVGGIGLNMRRIRTTIGILERGFGEC